LKEGVKLDQTYSIQGKIKQLSIILIPILVTQLGLFAMNFFDTIMSGQFSTTDLAGVAIGSSLWMPVFTGLSGILLSITPIVAQHVGAKKEKEVPQSVIQGVYVAVVMAIIIVIAGAFLLNPILNAMNIEDEVRRVAKYYLIALSFGIIPLFIYNVLRSFIDALGLTRISMFITLISLPLNIIFNYILIFGKLGFPALGGIGAGVASALTYWLIAIISVVIIHKTDHLNTIKFLVECMQFLFQNGKKFL